jgi:hypothetical protein
MALAEEAEPKVRYECDFALLGFFGVAMVRGWRRAKPADGAEE